MSQRGAMQMASLGYTYDQILGFYYENSVRVRYTFTHTILSALENGGKDTVTSTEEPAEITGGDACTATVQLVSGTDRLAIRASASSNGQILTSLMRGALVTVLNVSGDWTLVQYGEIVGDVTSDALKSWQGTPPCQRLCDRDHYHGLRHRSCLRYAESAPICQRQRQGHQHHSQQYSASCLFAKQRVGPRAVWRTGRLCLHGFPCVFRQLPQQGRRRPGNRRPCEHSRRQRHGEPSVRPLPREAPFLLSCVIAPLSPLCSNDGSWCYVPCEQPVRLHYVQLPLLRWQYCRLPTEEESPAEARRNRGRCAMRSRHSCRCWPRRKPLHM